MAELSIPQSCVSKSLKECNTYRCQVGIQAGANPNVIAQAQHICDRFEGLEGCVSQQACSAYFPTCTSMYKACHQTTQCIVDNTKPMNKN
jgi:hypothetical protein